MYPSQFIHKVVEKYAHTNHFIVWILTTTLQVVNKVASFICLLSLADEKQYSPQTADLQMVLFLLQSPFLLCRLLRSFIYISSKEDL